jgi:hypothetical protein
MIPSFLKLIKTETSYDLCHPIFPLFMVCTGDNGHNLAQSWPILNILIPIASTESKEDNYTMIIKIGHDWANFWPLSPSLSPGWFSVTHSAKEPSIFLVSIDIDLFCFCWRNEFPSIESLASSKKRLPSRRACNFLWNPDFSKILIALDEEMFGLQIGRKF